MTQAPIPNVELGAELGRGAHSVVLRGSRDGRSYAVKLPLEVGTSAEREIAYRRFLREAAALARVHHSSLPAVMEVGRAAGVPYLIMELASGETLAERLGRSAMSEAEVVPLALQLAGALEAIHAAGLLHRDVKPRNIVFDTSRGLAYLVDLGSAVLARGALGAGVTPAYAAPEVVADGLGGDARADLYSLGRVLLEALGNSGPGGARASRASSVPPHATPSLTDILSRLVESHPDERYPSATRLREELERLGERLSIVVAPAAHVSPRLFGRASELDRLRRTWAEAQRGGRVVVLRGAPGTGKTRLARAFLEDSAAAGVRILSAACHPRDPRAFAAVRQLVEAHLRACEQLPATERARAFLQLRKLAGDLASLLKLLSPQVARVFHDAPTVSTSENAEQAFSEGLAEFLGKLVKAAGPTIIFVDDVQWLDPSSRRVLVRAANQTATRRVLFVFGARDGEASVDVNRLLDILSAPVSVVELLPLAAEHVVDVVRDYLAVEEVDPELKDAVLRLSDGSPLCTLEVLRTLTDEGVLLPHWGRWRLDALGLTQMRLPSEAASLLRRRIQAIDPIARTVLTAASVIGMSFEAELLATVAPATAFQISAALTESRRSQLIEGAGGGLLRFVHHTVRETLLAECDGPVLEGLHQAVAEALDAEGTMGDSSGALTFEVEGESSGATIGLSGALGTGHDSPDADKVYRVAYHYAAGAPTRAATRRAETCILAGQAAFARFDNERATEFFVAAERALGSMSRALAPDIRMLLGDARLRAGALEEALIEFRRILAESVEPYIHATALLRMALIHDMRLDSIRAWQYVEQAFQKLGEPPPSETAGYTIGSLTAWAGRGLVRGARPPLEPAERLRYEALCSFYYQATRIALTQAKPIRVILSTLRSVRAAERLGPSASLAKSYLAYSFVLTVLGMPARGTHYLERAEEIARDLRDPFVYSHTLQVHMVIAAWGGRIQDSIDAGARCLTEYGHWRELSEFCINCYTIYQMETVRGRDAEAWKWIDFAIQRVNRHDGAPVVHEFLLLAARAGLSALGRQDEIPVRLHRLEQVTVAVPPDSGSGSYASTFGARVRVHTEKADLGGAFGALVSEFQGLRQDPKRVHMNVTEYYIHVAHARVHACLRAPPEQRAAPLAELALALGDLKAAAKIPLIQAHALAIEGYFEWFHGRVETARVAFDAAERLAVAETAPWILYSVHRARAHILRSEGRHDAARDQAVLAESVAVAHGAVYRARWVREEFGLRSRRDSEQSDVTGSASLPSPGLMEDGSTTVVGGSRAKRQLRALLRISQARVQELAPDHQARLVVDELVQALRAQRGFLFLRAGMAGAAAAGSDAPGRRDGELTLVAGRDAAGRNLDGADDYDRVAVGDALFADAEETDEAPSLRSRVATTARLSAIAVPLVVDDLTAGVICLDRPLAEGVFSEADGALLTALAGQVAVALELTRALRARERAQESLRNAEKMDAVARLGRGIAHDLNNMLSAIRLATMAMVSVPGASEIVGEDVQTIQSALQRANELTKQLGTFSQGEFGKPQLVRVGSRIDRLLPVVAGLVGESIHVEATIAQQLSSVLVDPDQLDHIVMNLVVNSRDAMPNGGRIRIEVSEVSLDEAYVREHPRVVPGRYVRLTLTDTGHGMDEDVRQKIFEPYFTTKRERGGTGLGLASVYWAVSSSGGHVDVTSSVGVGTTFTLHFPSAERTLRQRRPSAKPEERPTILIVERDAEAARQFEQALVELGYRVRVVTSGPSALEVVRQGTNDVDLAIIDVVMDGMNGLELARTLQGVRAGIGVLFTSGDKSGVLAERGIWREAGQAEFLQKPVAADILARRVREALGRRRPS